VYLINKINEDFRCFVFAVQAEAIVDMIGFPDFILNTTKLDERYEEVCAILFVPLKMV